MTADDCREIGRTIRIGDVLVEDVRPISTDAELIPCKAIAIIPEEQPTGVAAENRDLYLKSKVAEVGRLSVARAKVIWLCAGMIGSSCEPTTSVFVRRLVPTEVVWALQGVVDSRGAARCLSIDVL